MHHRPTNADDEDRAMSGDPEDVSSMKPRRITGLSVRTLGLSLMALAWIRPAAPIPGRGIREPPIVLQGVFTVEGGIRLTEGSVILTRKTCTAGRSGRPRASHPKNARQHLLQNAG